MFVHVHIYTLYIHTCLHTSHILTHTYKKERKLVKQQINSIIMMLNKLYEVWTGRKASLYTSAPVGVQ